MILTHKIICLIVIVFICFFYQATVVEQPVDLGSEKVTSRGFQILGSKIWEFRGKHMVIGLPSNNIFMLLPCYEVDCPHPVCTKGKLVEEPTWSLPIPDPERSWGSDVCTKCPGFCNGHYLEPKARIKWVSKRGSESCQKVPPKSCN